ncbi:alpha/beta fold hydrolase [Mycobacterium heidelbergense]|uniref:alpha/beta fold hydrolase n=1 Tax=Mycobacterium heidelbergense TaxID=53376 RepID=UPI003CFB3834
MAVDKRATARSRDLRVRTDDGVLLAVRDSGPETAPRTVVFLHGFCLTRVYWARQSAYLSRRYRSSVRVISYDHRGHGRSGAAPMSTYRIERLAEDLAQVLAAARVSGQVTLVGHSMGGMTALAYIGLHERPIEPHGLVLVATTAGKLAERGLGRLLATPLTAALPRLVEHTPDCAVRALVGPVCTTLGLWQGGTRSAAWAAIAASALTTTPLPTAVGFLPSLRAHDQYAALPSIRARTIVVSGGRDPLVPSAHGRDLAAGIAGASHVHLPQAGHMLPQEAPHVLNDIICRAMASEHGRTDSGDSREPGAGRQAVPA